ncbi:trehalose-phosphatase [Chloroflexota bacterium]
MREKSAMEMNLRGIAAVIFDMDGVLTDTASTHANAWKQLFDEYLEERARRHGEQFHPFEIDPEYYRYVDGKSRYEGVNSFLESRGITLPYGSPDDEANEETVCGLGNRKNQYFLDRLKKDGAQAYQSSIEFIRQLKKNHIKTAVISASRNSSAVLEAAGIGGLFDVKVDGVDSDELGLKSKPEPDIFLEAARRLGVKPERAAIVEDALAGVEAGRRGKFKLVVGVDRTGRGDELKEHGAHVVVPDLSQLRVRSSGSARKIIRTQALHRLPSALEKGEEVFRRLRRGVPAIFLDYDGTLTPIVDNPADALIPEKTREVVRRLAKHYTVAVISGRDLDDVRNMVGIDKIIYAGSHGFDIAYPDGSRNVQEQWERFLPALDSAEAELRSSLEGIAGAQVERKRFTIAVHFRRVDSANVDMVGQQVNRVLGQLPELRKALGKKVFEIRPDIDWGKGKALLSLLETLYVDSAQAVPLFIGDDVTDEDAFRVIRKYGIGIAVGEDERRTAARYVLKDPDEVAKLLENLVTIAEREALASPWILTCDGFDPDSEGLRETLCTLGNGYFATRGAAAESKADSVHNPGTYVAGCYNRVQTEIQDHTLEHESLVNVPNWLPLTFRIEGGHWFDLRQVTLLEYRQELDLQRGVLYRFVHFADKQGRQTRLTQRRFVSMAEPHLAGLETTIVAENWSGRLHIRSAFDGQVTNSGVARYRQLEGKHLEPVENLPVGEDIIYLQVETNQSRVRIAEAARTRAFKNGEAVRLDRQTKVAPGYIAHEFHIDVKQGEEIRVEKIVSLFTSRDRGISECGVEACKKANRAAGFDELLKSHVLSWDYLWRVCDIAMQDSYRIALLLHLHIFHLLQTVSLHTVSLDVGVPPRGLHGEAYRGHILWDELFIFPFLTLNLPDITRTLLQYRYRRLPEARWAAKQAGYEGAMYPWQSGSDGREESQTLHLNPRSERWIADNSHLQRHVNLAIAYNIWHYYQVTSDMEYLCQYGVEMFLEIARFWASIARYNRLLGRYEIHRVMGPDEYHDAYPDADGPGISNNAYTNIMVVWVLCRALEMLEILPDDRRQALWDKLSLKREELERWDDISRKMRVVFHEDGIISQFEGYEQLEEFDWEGCREKHGNIERLDRILEAEADSPNRYKVSKQADVLMLFYLLSADELRDLFNRLGYPFEYDTIPRTIEYYIRRTAHGSTLSRIVHSWVLARSQRNLSWRLFQEALESDISDIQGGTTPEGIHLGAMAGTVDLIQRCYTGLETRGDVLWLNPCLPDDLKEVKFDVRYRQQWINLWFVRDRMKITARRYDAAPIKIGFKDGIFELGPGETLELPYSS